MMKKIILNNDIFSYDSIDKAIQAYKKIALIRKKCDGNKVVLTFWKCKYDEELTIKEFENYLIGIENS